MIFFETIRIEGGVPHHLDYHQRRVDRTVAAHFPDTSPPRLADHLAIPLPDNGIYRCRLLYDRKVREVALTPYRPRPVQTLRLLHADLRYDYKALERSAIDALFAERGDADDILVVRDGLVTDTSIANIAFLQKGRWYTPQTPLLPGTTRARLLEAGRLTPRPILADELPRYEAFALLNAMIGFRIVKNGKIAP